MKKILIGIVCCIGLLLATTVNGVDFAYNDKPEITFAKPSYNVN
ncbi:hypothetical protein MHB48_18325 [Psychrobacillus sp. FSL H8-0483]